jgi:hypothetical protein
VSVKLASPELTPNTLTAPGKEVGSPKPRREAKSEAAEKLSIIGLRQNSPSQMTVADGFFSAQTEMSLMTRN